MHRFSLVLHAHMPWVLEHGYWPHGEVWLLEAAVHVYVPILQMLERCSSSQETTENHLFSIGLTPVLLLQLTHPDFPQKCRDFLHSRIEQAMNLREETIELAEFWLGKYRESLAYVESIQYDIVGRFRHFAENDWIEILTSSATHGFSPLFIDDRTFALQVEKGIAISRKILGYTPTGFWLPECAFLPQSYRESPVDGRSVFRRGMDRILEEHGISHFFVESVALENTKSEGKIVVENHKEVFLKTSWQEAEDNPSAWKTVVEPKRVSTTGGMSQIHAFARHPELCAQVWAADGGYPGDGRYLEFHKKHGDLKLWAVTSRSTSLGEKEAYNPMLAKQATKEHAQHFAHLIEKKLTEVALESENNRHITLCFDAELFGHWWFEGVDFLENLLQIVQQKQDIMLCSPKNVVEQCPSTKVVWIPECTWGAKANHSVWLHDGVRWMWKVLHSIEERFWAIQSEIHSVVSASTKKRNAKNSLLRELFLRLEWEMLLVQASDWIFVITTKGAVDYGHRRFCLHVERWERLYALITKIKAQEKPVLSAIEKAQLEEIRQYQGDIPNIHCAAINPSKSC